MEDYYPPLIGRYPQILRAQRAQVSSTLTRANLFAPPQAGVELEYFLIGPDGRLRHVADAVIAAGGVSMGTEICTAAAETITQPHLVGPGMYLQQERQLRTAFDAIRLATAKFGCAPLLSTAGMPMEIPDPWNAENDVHCSMLLPVPRCRSMVINAVRWAGVNPPQVPLHSGGHFTLTPPHSGTAASFQANFSWPGQEFAAWRRAVVSIAGFSAAMSVASPILMGQRLALKGHRVVTFPGSFYGTTNGWPRHFSLAPGGHLLVDGVPLENGDALHAAFAAQLHPERPFLASPPDDLEHAQQLLWAQKSIYDAIRCRYSRGEDGWPPHFRLETRWCCTQPTILDNIALLYCQRAMAMGLRALFGDGTIIPYDAAEANLQAAVRMGLDAEVLYPSLDRKLTLRPVHEVAAELLRVGYLEHLREGFAPEELARYHGILMERLNARVTFADVLTSWHKDAPDTFQLYAVVEGWSRTEKPFHTWPMQWADALKA